MEDLINPVFHRLRNIPMTDIWKMLFLLLHTYVGGALLFNHLNNNEVVWIGTQVSTFPKAVFDVLLGKQEGLPLAHKLNTCSFFWFTH